MCVRASICIHVWRGESSCKHKWELPWELITRVWKYACTSRTWAKQWMFYNTVFHMQQKMPRVNQEARARVILWRQEGVPVREIQRRLGEGFVSIHQRSLFRLATSTVHVHNTLYTCSVCLHYCYFLTYHRLLSKHCSTDTVVDRPRKHRDAKLDNEHMKFIN